ncbi:MAG: rRNA maturation RNase YbeY [Adhaeribacter sp.]
MPESLIEFVTEDIEFTLINQNEITDWLNQIISKHGYQLENLTYVFCSDEYLHDMNVEYLNHDTYTDIITFDNADDAGVIESDIFISIDRVKENAQLLGTSFPDELHRVMVHGVLHLLGFDDKTPELKAQMQQEEDRSLKARKFSIEGI